MEKEYKNWKYIEKTPAHGSVYHHKNRKTIIIVYHGCIRLYRDFPEIEGKLYPCFGKTCLERKK